ncbi:TIM barrel protein [Dendrosporobacter sp. 1207_IL3150]|uniref:TIM barrel protein n=1 Tax=Dendrosporobacter sp. 1207_IL3150 TaxID=3084054 RepID=UPI002FDAEBBD
MLQLVNLSNYSSDRELIRDSSQLLRAFLNYHHLDGVEMMICAPWDARVHKKEWIHGVHLMFWPCWLDFWRGDKQALLRQFTNEADIKAYYGTLDPLEWLETFRENIRRAKAAEAKYIVFHVSHAKTAELFKWSFSADDNEVINAVIEVVNALAEDIPPGMELLFENLWWPGLTLLDKAVTAKLLDSVKHRNVGIMLDTGHLMNTNPALKTEADGVDYIIKTVENLGVYCESIKGIHLHCSLSGEYLKNSQAQQVTGEITVADVMEHVMKIDQHLPFRTSAVKRLVDYIKPKYLVHEFINEDLTGWSQKIFTQQQALGCNKEG